MSLERAWVNATPDCLNWTNRPTDSVEHERDKRRGSQDHTHQILTLLVSPRASSNRLTSGYCMELLTQANLKSGNECPKSLSCTVQPLVVVIIAPWEGGACNGIMVLHEPRGISEWTI